MFRERARAAREFLQLCGQVIFSIEGGQVIFSERVAR